MSDHLGPAIARGIDGLRVADASVMPTIPAGDTYLGCVMVAEHVARRMTAAAGGTGASSIER